MPANKWLFNQQALQEYLLCCCQESIGGLIDKPGKHRDYYHTCYDLSGLSIAQNSLSSQLIVGGEYNKVVSFDILISDSLVLIILFQTFAQISGSNSSFIQSNNRFRSFCK
jgi:prenyltransferase beta subunit